ncbi:MAG: hypothetical protein ACRC1X_06820 [Lactobacillus panisapium]
MTLSNIFFGKKVVQQAYLNNALIYQSKGWETLPSTCMEEWTKDYDMASGLTNLTSDLDNNIYALSNDSLYKFNSDGSIVWQKKFKEFAKNGEYNNAFCYLKFDSINNTIFTLKSNNDKYNWFICELTINGLIKNEYSIKDICSFNFDRISSFEIDNNYLYVSGFSVGYNYEIYDDYLMKIDRITKKLVQKTAVYIANNTLVNVNDEYLYAVKSNASNTGVLERFDKDNITNSSIIDDLNNASIDDHITSITGDRLGNVIYKTFNNGTYKYSDKNKTKTKLQVYGANSNNSICIDYQQNVYIIEHIDPNKSTNILKFSSDNTLIYDIPIENATEPNLTVDYKGNIYYTWRSSNGQTHIKKLINIEKKGN